MNVKLTTTLLSLIAPSLAQPRPISFVIMSARPLPMLVRPPPLVPCYTWKLYSPAMMLLDLREGTQSAPIALTATKETLTYSRPTNVDLVNSFHTEDDDSKDKGEEDKGKDGGAPTTNFPVSIKILTTYLFVDDQQMNTIGCLEHYALEVATYSFFDLESKEEMYFVVLQNKINLTLKASMATYILQMEGKLVEDRQCDFVES